MSRILHWLNKAPRPVNSSSDPVARDIEKVFGKSINNLRKAPNSQSEIIIVPVGSNSSDHSEISKETPAIDLEKFLTNSPISFGDALVALIDEKSATSDLRVPGRIVSIETLHRKLDESPFSRMEGMLSPALEAEVQLVRRALYISLYEHLRLGTTETERDLAIARKNYGDAEKEIAKALRENREIRKEDREALLDSYAQEEAKRLAEIAAAFEAERAAAQKAHDAELNNELDIPGSTEPLRRYRERASRLPERKRSLVGTLAHHLSRSKLGSIIKGALAAAAIFALATTETAREPQTSHSVVDTNRGEKPEQNSAAQIEEARGLVIEATIPPAGAIHALKEMVAAAPSISWIPRYLEDVRAHARPELARTREGRLEAVAMNLGFMTDYTLDAATGTYRAESPVVPAGTVLRIDEQGAGLTMPDGSARTLIAVDEYGIARVTPYAR